jgi:hypothetical protein
MSNATFFTADRTTHMKIVAISLAASVAVLLGAIAARTTTGSDATAHIQTTAPVKAGKPIAISDSNTSIVR